jgi:hypothetical protein
MTKRRLLIVLAALAVVVLLAPLWSGYFGPGAAAYATTWRPWRTHVSVRYEHTRAQRSTLEVYYHDYLPDPTRNPGERIDFLTLKRSRSWLPWVVTERGTGP